jgi:hypothetical protein
MTLHDDPAEPVNAFADGKDRFPTLLRLQALADAALTVVRDGLKHPNWHVRHWCAIYIDRHGREEALHDLVPLLTEAMLATLPSDGRVPAPLEAALALETDAKLRLHIARALAVHRRH